MLTPSSCYAAAPQRQVSVLPHRLPQPRSVPQLPTHSSANRGLQPTGGWMQSGEACLLFSCMPNACIPVLDVAYPSLLYDNSCQQMLL